MNYLNAPTLMEKYLDTDTNDYSMVEQIYNRQKNVVRKFPKVEIVEPVKKEESEKIDWQDVLACIIFLGCLVVGALL